MVERARWRKDKIRYHERRCSLCNIHDVQDEYHITMICEYFMEVNKIKRNMLNNITTTDLEW